MLSALIITWVQKDSLTLISPPSINNQLVNFLGTLRVGSLTPTFTFIPNRHCYVRNAIIPSCSLLRCVGLLQFIFHVLQTLPKSFTQRNLCRIDKSMRIDLKMGHPWFNARLWIPSLIHMSSQSCSLSVDFLWKDSPVSSKHVPLWC